MKKVLLAFDGQHFSKGVFEFVKHMNAQQPVMAAGLFLPSVDYVELLYSFGGVPAGPLYITESVPADEQVMKDNIARFTRMCEENGIACIVHAGYTKHVVKQIKEETRFADLLVISSKLFYENLGVETQDDYIENTLHGAECPVVLVPEGYKEPASIIMAYDGSETAVYAIKQFTYLFPEFHKLQVLLAYLHKNKAGVPERDHMEELLSGHFTHYSLLKLKIDSRKELEEWLESNGDTLLVSGAYGRTLFSEMFKKSFISEVIHQHKVPIFVAHK